MRTFSILTAAALGLAAGVSLANAQATNFAPSSGDARAYYGGGDVPGYRWRRSRAMARSQWGWSGPRAYYGAPYGAYYGYYGDYGPGRTEGIPPALYHAGDPQYWR
jgi:hypothetical protein